MVSSPSPPPEAEAVQHLDRVLHHFSPFHLGHRSATAICFQLIGNAVASNVAETVLGLARGIPTCPASGVCLPPTV